MILFAVPIDYPGDESADGLVSSSNRLLAKDNSIYHEIVRMMPIQSPVWERKVGRIEHKALSGLVIIACWEAGCGLFH
jgi:hypothetical protein